VPNDKVLDSVLTLSNNLEPMSSIEIDINEIEELKKLMKFSLIYLKIPNQKIC